MKNQSKQATGRWKMRLLCVGLCLVLAGCAWLTRPPDVYQVERHRSDIQTLRLVNNHSGPIIIRAANGEQQVRLETGESHDFEFIVISLADLRLSESDPWYIIQNTTINYAHEPGGTRFMKTTGTDVELDIRLASGQPDPLRLSLQNCPQDWEAIQAPAGTHMVRSRAMAGVPQRLCPP